MGCRCQRTPLDDSLIFRSDSRPVVKTEKGRRRTILTNYKEGIEKIKLREFLNAYEETLLLRHVSGSVYCDIFN